MINSQYKKITQSLRYLISQSKDDRVNVLLLMKLVWAADRYHLRNYGRLVTNDGYRALPKGPVCSIALDIANQSDFLSPEQIDYSKQYVARDKNDDIIGVMPTQMDYLSDSDLEALEFAWKTFGSKDRFDVVDITHEYPEWSKFAGLFNSGGSSEEMDIRDFFKDPANDKYFMMNKEQLDANREKLEEDLALKNFFRA